MDGESFEAGVLRLDGAEAPADAGFGEFARDRDLRVGVAVLARSGHRAFPSMRPSTL